MALARLAALFRLLGIGNEHGTHDYTVRVPGHDFTFSPEQGGLVASMNGWGYNLKEGDFLILPNGPRTTRYRIRRVTYYHDPPDMWSADVVFAPRMEAKDGQ